MAREVENIAIDPTDILVTDKVAVDVDIALEKPIGYFSLVRTVTFPFPEGSRPAEFEVFVGFDRATPGAG